LRFFNLDEIDKILNNKFDHTETNKNSNDAVKYESEDEEEDKTQLEPYSVRSRVEDKKHKNNVVDRLYTLKVDKKKVSTMNEQIKVEDDYLNTKYDKFMENSLIDTNKLKGHHTIVHKHGSLLSPNIVQHRHRHSNSETLIKSSSFKSSNKNHLVSMYAKKALSPNNPSLLISKKPIEKQLSSNFDNNKKMIMSKLASKLY
jgi:hypothetical protein